MMTHLRFRRRLSYPSFPQNVHEIKFAIYVQNSGLQLGLDVI